MHRDTLRQLGRDAVGLCASATTTLGLFLAAPAIAWLWMVTVPIEAEVIGVPMEERLAVVWQPEVIEPASEPTPSSAEPIQSAESATAEGPQSDTQTAQTTPAAEAVVEQADPNPPLFSPLAVVAQNRVRAVLKPEEVGQGRKARSAPSGTPLSPVRVPGRKKGRGVPCRDSYKGVEENQQGHWTVNREIVDYYTSSIARFNSLGWSGPHNGDEVKGWKIGGFSCNSPLHFAGLRRGDIVLSVNDRPTRTWFQVFGAYRKLQRKSEFKVEVIRRGKPHTLRYTLVG